MRRVIATFCAVLLCIVVSPSHARAGEVRVADSEQLRAAVRQSSPGTTFLLAAGVYEGGLYLENAAGTEEAPIVIAGLDANNPPVFRGGGQALHLADCRYVTLRNIRAEGFPSNGINIDGCRKPQLPTAEQDGIYFCDAGADAYDRTLKP